MINLLSYEAPCVNGECPNLGEVGALNAADCTQIAQQVMRAGGAGYLENGVCMVDVMETLFASIGDGQTQEIRDRLGVVGVVHIDTDLTD